MEFDNQVNSEVRSELSDFSDSEASHEEKKGKKEKGILGAKKKEKEKKSKDKEARYATLGDESSGEEEGKKKSKKKGFQFGSAKKEKKEKKDPKDPKEKKEKKDKEKGKLKLKKLRADADLDGKSKQEELPVFGVSLEQAVERSRCHDGIKLPVVIRDCIDYIEEHGLKVEGIYRSSGVKSKVNKLKIAYNTRKSVTLAGCEHSVVASLLKLFLRELPDPVLTNKLLPKFEEACTAKESGQTVANLRSLMDQLPDCNRTLVDWIFVHMGHVIQYEKLNKMSLQNVSIVLSPTMQISHRVLFCLFKHSIPLFGHVNLRKYVPPISGPVGVNLLPESPHAIEEEMKKQESLLEDLHREISQGKASKATEEKLWEQQRIVTQLKRKLRLAKSSTKPEDHARQDHEEELNFSLQKPSGPQLSQQKDSSSQDTVIENPKAHHNSSLTSNINTMETIEANSSENDKQKSLDDNCSRQKLTNDGTIEVNVTDKKNLSSPEDKDESGQEHKVTVQIHQSDSLAESSNKPCVTVIKLSQPGLHDMTERKVEVEKSSASVADPNLTSEGKLIVTSSPPSVTAVSASQEQVRQTITPPLQPTPVTLPSTSASVKSEDQVDSSSKELNANTKITKKVGDYENVDVKFKKVDFKPEEKNSKLITDKCDIKEEKTRDDFPLLPPPPASNKPSSRGLLKVMQPQEAKMKSKSLPRGLPSDIGSVVVTPATALPPPPSSQDAVKKPVLEPAIEDLLWEELRLKYQYEELLNLKSELERKKKMERREISELHEEIATMQTLYQYRTYSVDSSEDSDAEEENNQHFEDNRVLLRQLMLDQSELQQKKNFLLDKLETERQVCLNLRVQIRMEQEKLRRRGLLDK